MIQIELVYYPEENPDPTSLLAYRAPIVPRVGETLMLDAEDADTRGLCPRWEVVDVLYNLPAQGGDVVSAVVYVEPAEDDV